MKLTDLDPHFLSEGGTHADGSPNRKGVGLACQCPCGCDNGLYVPFANPLDGGPAIERGWQRTGDTFETLTLTPSILRVGGCGWHGYVTAGEIITV